MKYFFVFRYHWQKVEELCDKKENVLKHSKEASAKNQDGGSSRNQDGGESDSMSDSETLEELLDWRSKKI